MTRNQTSFNFFRVIITRRGRNLKGLMEEEREDHKKRTKVSSLNLQNLTYKTLIRLGAIYTISHLSP